MVVEAESSQIRAGRVVPTDSYWKQLTEQEQLCAPRSTRRRMVRSVEQPIKDVEVVHAQDVHDPAVKTDVTHIINETVANEVVQPYAVVADEIVQPDVVMLIRSHMLLLTQRSQLFQSSRLCTLMEDSWKDPLIRQC